MDAYRRQAADSDSMANLAGIRETVNDAGGVLRQLIPFPGADTLTSLPLLSAAVPGTGLPAPVPVAVPEVEQQAASIVSQAAAVLDEEMARGVLAARSAGPASARSAAADPSLRQLQTLVDSLAAMWPAGGLPEGLSAPYRQGSGAAEPLSDLRPQGTVRPGQRATILMTLSNSEGRPLRLVAAATDLLGSRGGRIAASQLQCSPSEVSLAAGEQRDITITTTVPAETMPGCYSGLLVVSGVDYLRAVITIDVV